jgi:hypothetical protein
VGSIQAFGAALPFHPHLHALSTDGLLARDGVFVPIAAPDAKAVEELFRRLVIAAVAKAERLSEEFAETLLGWEHSGFSVYAEQVVLAHEKDRLARLARYMARAPLADARVREGRDGRLLVRTPLDPRTGATEVAFGPLELIHALAQQIADKGQHVVRYYGAYANRARKLYRAAEEEAGGRGGREDPRDAESEFARERRRSWARLLRKLLEVDPLLCPKCGVERIVAVITDPQVIDRILERLDASGGHDPFDARAPPEG